MFKKGLEVISLNEIGYILVGLLMIIWPATVSNFICYIIGALLIAFGVTRILLYIKLTTRNKLSTFLVIIGIILSAFGIYIIAEPEKFASFVPIILGAYVIILGVAKINELKVYKDTSMYVYILISAVLMVIVGTVIIINPFATLTLLIRILGIFFTILGISNLYSIIKFRKETKALQNI